LSIVLRRRLSLISRGFTVIHTGAASKLKSLAALPPPGEPGDSPQLALSRRSSVPADTDPSFRAAHCSHPLVLLRPRRPGVARGAAVSLPRRLMMTIARTSEGEETLLIRPRPRRGRGSAAGATVIRGRGRLSLEHLCRTSLMHHFPSCITAATGVRHQAYLRLQMDHLPLHRVARERRVGQRLTHHLVQLCNNPPPHSASLDAGPSSRGALSCQCERERTDCMLATSSCVKMSSDCKLRERPGVSLAVKTPAVEGRRSMNTQWGLRPTVSLSRAAHTCAARPLTNPSQLARRSKAPQAR
jgi:hypothetical protein